MTKCVKYLFTLLFFSNLCLCVSIYLTNRKQLESDRRVNLPDVYSERTVMRFKKHNIKVGGCPKDMVWYYGRCRKTKRKENDYYDYELPVYDDVNYETDNDEDFAQITTTVNSEVTEDSISTTTGDNKNDIDNIPKHKIDIIIAVPDYENKMETTSFVPDYSNNTDTTSIIPDYWNKKDTKDVLTDYKNESDVSNISYPDKRSELNTTTFVPDYGNKTNTTNVVPDSGNVTNNEESVPSYKNKLNTDFNLDYNTIDSDGPVSEYGNKTTTIFMYCFMLLLLCIIVIYIRLCIIEYCKNYTDVTCYDCENLIDHR